MNARLPRGASCSAASPTERDRRRTTAPDLANSNPNNLRFCDQVPPFQTLYKASAGYMLPYDIQFSGSFQARPGISIGVDLHVQQRARPAVAAHRRRQQLSVTVVDPTTQFYDYVKTNDMRVVASVPARNRAAAARSWRCSTCLNLSTICTVNETVGPQYFNPRRSRPGRGGSSSARRSIGRTGLGRRARLGQGPCSARGLTQRPEPVIAYPVPSIWRP